MVANASGWGSCRVCGRKWVGVVGGVCWMCEKRKRGGKRW